MKKTSRKEKTPPGDFKVTPPKNPLINNQAVTRIRNLPNYPWPISKYQPTIEPLLQYPIGIDLVVAFFPLCTNLQFVTNPLHGSQVHD